MFNTLISRTKRYLDYLVKVFFYFPCCILRIQRLGTHNDLGELVDFVIEDRKPLIWIVQVRSEILNLLEILDRVKPKYILELGTASGGTLLLFARVACKDAHIITIDLPGGRYGDRYRYPWWQTCLLRSFGFLDQEIHLIRSDSHSEATLEKVKAILNNNEIVSLFIDGDHSYDGVKKDFEMYAPLVTHDGIIAFHDIVFHSDPAYAWCQVDKFWNEIKTEYEYEELVESWDQGGAGIGLIKMVR